MSKDQESNEQRIDEFIKEFKSLSQKNLQEYEKENRDRLDSAPKEVRDAFDDKWKKVNGNRYFQPVSEQRKSPEPYRVDPASNNYLIDGKEGYWEVMFSEKSNPHDPDDVTLTVNGECLHIQRNVRVILPGRFLEAADHGAYPVFKQLPGVSRKIVSSVKHFPYTTLRIASKEEYDNMKREGDRLTQEQRQKEERF